MSYEELLREHGYTMEDVNKAFYEKTKELEKIRYVIEKLPLGEKMKRKKGKRKGFYCFFQCLM